MSKRSAASRAEKVGLPPGTLMYVGESSCEKPKIYVSVYDEQHFEEAEVGTIEEAFQFQSKGSLLWINIDGLQDVDVIRKVGEHFKIHPLVLEDILNPNQRPKKENFESFLFVVAKALRLVGEDHELESEQVSIVLGPKFVISFQERVGDVFEPIRQRLRNPNGRLRKLGSDYLLYALLDTIVDAYFVVLEHVGEEIEKLEEELIENPTPDTLHTLHAMKRTGLFFRRAVWPLREVISGLEREECELMQRNTILYLRDVYDHVVQVIDTVETYREMYSGMLDIYLSSVSNKMNVVMKVLTIFATIFMPLTFIAGIYGMNFEHMPELKWEYGYPLSLGLMGVMTVVMLLFFRYKKWL